VASSAAARTAGTKSTSKYEAAAARPKATRQKPEPVTAPAAGADAEGSDRRTYVLDTSVLLADPGAFSRFAEHKVVLPLVVIAELEAKRNHPELGFFARAALRHLDDLRISHGRLDADMEIGDFGGTIRVELNHTDPSVLPAGFRLGDNDTRILSVARSLAMEAGVPGRAPAGLGLDGHGRVRGRSR